MRKKRRGPCQKDAFNSETQKRANCANKFVIMVFCQCKFWAFYVDFSSSFAKGGRFYALFLCIFFLDKKWACANIYAFCMFACWSGPIRFSTIFLFWWWFQTFFPQWSRIRLGFFVSLRCLVQEKKFLGVHLELLQPLQQQKMLPIPLIIITTREDFILPLNNS